MKQKYVIALYIRLSVEDFKTESLSIPNQKLILREKAMSLRNGITAKSWNLLITAIRVRILSVRRYRSF